MLVERSNNQINITLDAGLDSFNLQRIIDFARYIELTSKSKAKQKEIDALSEETMDKWWKKNSKKFIK